MGVDKKAKVWKENSLQSSHRQNRTKLVTFLLSLSSDLGINEMGLYIHSVSFLQKTIKFNDY